MIPIYRGFNCTFITNNYQYNKKDILEVIKKMRYLINRKEVEKMAEILESVMLICFGLSWPINVWKNIKSKTAKNMSLKFILLIIVGYIAGIVAKLSKGAVNYVLVVYILNLAIVSVNVVVYFVNKRYDQARAAAVESKPVVNMKNVG